MKKLLGISTLALALLAASEQKAKAWCNFNFGVGMNLGWQSGNNSFLGIIKNGPVGVEGAGPGYITRGGGQGHGGGGMTMVSPNYGGGFGAPGFGGPGFGGPGFGAPVMDPGAQAWTAPAPTPSNNEPPKEQSFRGNLRPVPYQAVSYPQTYYTPTYNYGNQPAYSGYSYAPYNYAPAYPTYGNYYQPESYYQGW
jgi:hypothetical protein